MGLRLLRLGVGAAFFIGAIFLWTAWEMNGILATLMALVGVFCIFMAID